MDLLYGNSMMDVELANYENEAFVPNGIIRTITKEVLTENPVYYKNVYTSGAIKAGYLVYNQFVNTFNQDLDEAFAYFQSEGITDLILDLRYNSGGSVQTASYLASMILGENNQSVFAELRFNSKHTEDNKFYSFTNSYTPYDAQGNAMGSTTIHSVNINSLIVITTYQSASASELIINGIKPFVPIVQIGTTTRGKDVGSITLFDSPIQDFLSKNSANTNHKWAMQPIVFKTYNAHGESDYSQGFAPDTFLNELQHIEGFLTLGNPDETLLSAALAHLGFDRPGVSLALAPTSLDKVVDLHPLSHNLLEGQMYISPNEE